MQLNEKIPELKALLALDNPKALKQIDKKIDYAKKLKDSNLLANLLITKGKYLFHSGYPSESELFHLQALKIADDAECKEFASTVYNHIGIHYGKMNMLEKATQYFTKALENNNEIQYEVLLNLSTVKKKSGDYLKAIEYAVKASIVGKDIKNNRKKVTCFFSIGTTLGEMGMHEKAIDYLDKAYQLNKLSCEPSESMNAKCFAMIGSQLIELNKSEIAIYYLEKSRVIFESLKEKFEVNGVYLKLAKLYLDTNDENLF